MARRHRSIRTIRELREEAEAAEARGLSTHTPSPGRPSAREEAPAARSPKSQPRMRIVWAVCDLGGRTVATFPYPDRPQAEAHAQALKQRGKGNFFVRSIKEPITPE